MKLCSGHFALIVAALSTSCASCTAGNSVAASSAAECEVAVAETLLQSDGQYTYVEPSSIAAGDSAVAVFGTPTFTVWEQNGVITSVDQDNSVGALVSAAGFSLIENPLHDGQHVAHMRAAYAGQGNWYVLFAEMKGPPSEFPQVVEAIWSGQYGLGGWRQLERVAALRENLNMANSSQLDFDGGALIWAVTTTRGDGAEEVLIVQRAVESPWRVTRVASEAAHSVAVSAAVGDAWIAVSVAGRSQDHTIRVHNTASGFTELARLTSPAVLYSPTLHTSHTGPMMLTYTSTRPDVAVHNIHTAQVRSGIVSAVDEAYSHGPWWRVNSNILLLTAADSSLRLRTPAAEAVVILPRSPFTTSFSATVDSTGVIWAIGGAQVPGSALPRTVALAIPGAAPLSRCTMRREGTHTSK